MKTEILTEARKQIGLLLQNLSQERKLSIDALSELTGMSNDQILDITLNRKNYPIDDFLRFIQALDVYFFLSEKEGEHLNFDHMLKKANPDEAAL